MRRARWINGRKSILGWWTYNWAADRFHIELDSRDPITGGIRKMTVAGDEPEWGNWKLDREYREE